MVVTMLLVNTALREGPKKKEDKLEGSRKGSFGNLHKLMNINKTNPRR